MQITIDHQPSYVYTGGKALNSGGTATPSAIVFIHGAQQDHSCWSLQSRWFAHHGYNTLVPDLPGHGRSGGAPLGSVEALADWVIALLDAVGIAKATLVGHSLGSLVVIEAALRYPSRVAQAVLVAPSLPMPVSEALLDAAANGQARAAAMINEWSYSAHGQMGGNAASGMWMLGINQRLMERQPAAAFHTDLNACNAYSRPVETLAALNAPTLILAGARDRMTSPKVAKLLASTVPHARLVTLVGGHALMAEQPDAVLDAIRVFVAEQEAVPQHG